ncbi:hypothetical protein EUZ95_14500 [Enterococcus durans]|uniref:hypothetical protein n=1 Tax=Enterococcus durans TaxID=53345 RepID=UPI00103DBDA4|nr:hypothetical protein [Enterococcus durans]TBX29813.1 hypothetical protein EUZ95_14500 [Enterococcus durans]
MIETFLIELQLIRQRFGIYGFFNISSLSIVLLAIFLGIKLLLFSNSNYPELSLMVSLFLLIVGLCDIAPSTKKLFKKMSIIRAFFPSIKIYNIKKYFVYKKIILSLMLIIYGLMPLKWSIDNTKFFINLVSILLLLMLINSLFTIFFSKNIKDSVYFAMRILYGVILALNIRSILPFELNLILKSGNLYIIIFIFLILLTGNFILLKLETRV